MAQTNQQSLLRITRRGRSSGLTWYSCAPISWPDWFWFYHWWCFTSTGTPVSSVAKGNVLFFLK